MRISDWSSDVCSSDLLVVGSESGMVLLPEASVRKKGRLGPGQMIAVDLDNGTLYEDLAIKDKIADAQDYPSRVKGFRTMADLPKGGKSSLPGWDRQELLRRQIAAGLHMENMEDRKNVGEGKGVTGSVEIGGHSNQKK